MLNIDGPDELSSTPDESEILLSSSFVVTWTCGLSLAFQLLEITLDNFARH